MSTDAKKTAGHSAYPSKGMKIFMYPKIIFIWPTLAVSIICAIGMTINHNRTMDPTKPVNDASRVAPHEIPPQPTASVDTKAKVVEKDKNGRPPAPIRRFTSPQNVFGLMFITVFFLNLVIMSIDFPRFTVIGLILLAVAMTFFLLWLNAWYDVLPGLVYLMEGIFVTANSTFYTLVAVCILLNFAFIFASRYLDYWEILPNEILHNHGPFSDLERFPTTNLKFDKEIPDILEYALLRSGRLVLHIQNERKAIVLDNVLFIDAKEERLKQIMSRMEVRITSDKEAEEPI